ncbi:hypothetical protein C1645_838435 [Glomus cerebriforme]|uniref:Uncharacterized protein n=1 Tax=Glomus cerebriforme TaxID=658196 RepID=A0A397S754_9GLOM|nr:hypothetical protein C1645_838435 [Glomus cerebriforme]
MRITESVSPSGNCITFEGSGKILARVIELISVKVEGNKTAKMLYSTIVQVQTSIMSIGGTVAGAAVGGPVGAAAGGAAAKIGTGILQTAANQLMESPRYEETTHMMSFNEFRHKYLFSKDRPISLRLEYHQGLANQFLNRRELKGNMNYDYTQLQFFGYALAQKDFLKASVISLNMTRNSAWFREKIESGIYLYDENHTQFYEKKLTNPVLATSQGGISRGHWDEFVTRTGAGEQILITSNITNADYSNEDYIGSPDRCLCGGGSHNNPNYNFKNTINLTVGGTITLKTRASGAQSCTIPAAGIPPSNVITPGGDGNNNPPSTPFNPNQFPGSGNLTPTPGGSGEFEPNVPDIDVSPDPDFDPSLDPDIGVDPETDPTQDPDIPTEPDEPPDSNDPEND